MEKEKNMWLDCWVDHNIVLENQVKDNKNLNLNALMVELATKEGDWYWSKLEELFQHDILNRIDVIHHLINESSLDDYIEGYKQWILYWFCLS